MKTKLQKKVQKKTFTFMSWFVYVIILFEMFYMATPFAIFFYSVYAGPLNFLSSGAGTAWLIQTILPHFTETNSIVVSVLLYISWPLMITGLLIFLIAFVQIYWAKFTKKGAVLGGLYKYIRHPQYLAWAVFGFGMSLYWSRMIVLIMYVTMLFVYYFLAKSEEKECLRKFGNSYKEYMSSTGMFFPKLQKNNQRKNVTILPEKGIRRIFTTVIIYFITILMVIGIGFSFRNYIISQINTYTEKNYTAVSLIPLNEQEIKDIVYSTYYDNKVMKVLNEEINPDSDKMLIYILPESWKVGELAIVPENNIKRTFNPVTHGNSSDYNSDKLKVLFSLAISSSDVEGIEILSKSIRQIPELIISFNRKDNNVTQISFPPEEWKYEGVPVPIY